MIYYVYASYREIQRGLRIVHDLVQLRKEIRRVNFGIDRIENGIKAEMKES